MRSVRDPASIRVQPIAVRAAHDEARVIVERARTEAQSILDDAERRASLEVEHAVELAARTAREQVVAQLSASLVRAERALAVTERDVIALALDVARTVLGREAESSPSFIEAVARRSLQRVRRARAVVLRVHRDDLALARERVREWLAPGAEPSVLDVLEDESVERGGVVVECDLGRIDGRIDSQLAAIGRALEGS